MSSEAKVGALFVLALALLAFFIIRIDVRRFNREETQQFRVVLDDAQGLRVKAPVLLKGVLVGRVAGLDLSPHGVEATVLVTRRAPLRAGTTAVVASVGLLGEKQLDLVPGPADAPLLADGARLEGAKSTSLDDVMGTVGNIGEDVQGVTGRLRDVASDEEVLDQLRDILANVTGITREIERAIRVNREEMAATFRGVRELSEASAGLAKRLEAIGAKLDDGQGTLGQLIDSPELGDNLNSALVSVSDSTGAVDDALDWMGKTRVTFGVRGDYLARSRTGKGTFGVELRPPSPNFLRLEVVARGLEPTGRPGVSSDLTASALVGRRAGPFAFRGGLIEGSPGVGLDVLLWQDRLRLSGDTWDFSRNGLAPRARLEGAIEVVGGLSLLGGWNELLNGELRSVFLGAGVQMR